MSGANAQSWDQPPGLAMAARLNGKGGTLSLEWENGVPKDAPSGYWVHLDYTAEGVEDWLHQATNLEELDLDALLASGSQPRCSSTAKRIILFVRGMPGAASSEVIEPASMRCVLTEDGLISMRRHRHQAALDVMTALEEKKGPSSPAELLAHLIESLTDITQTSVEAFDQSLISLEDDVIDENIHVEPRRVNDLRRKILAMRRYMVPQREALDTLSRSKSAFLDTDIKHWLSELSERTRLIVDELSECRDRAKIISEELATQANERVAKSSFLLTIVAAVFLPLGLLSGMFGMNVGGVPYEGEPEGFWIVSGIMVALILLALWIFKRFKIL